MRIVSLRPVTWSVVMVGIAFVAFPQSLSAQSSEAAGIAKRALTTLETNDQTLTDADSRAAAAMTGGYNQTLTDMERRAAAAMTGGYNQTLTDMERRAAAAMSR